MSDHIEKLRQKADRDPFYNQRIKKTEKPKLKHFRGYNWITIEKAIKGQKKAIDDLKQIESRTDAEERTLTRLKALHKWASWAWSQHKGGKSDKTIHDLTLKGEWRK